MTILGQQLGPALCKALGLPKYTIGFTLRARVGEMVTIECEYAPEQRVQDGDFTAIFAQYNLVPASDAAREIAHPAEAMGYDTWLRERTERAHAEYMARTSRYLPCDWNADLVARYMSGSRA